MKLTIERPEVPAGPGIATERPEVPAGPGVATTVSVGVTNDSAVAGAAEIRTIGIEDAWAPEPRRTPLLSPGDHHVMDFDVCLPHGFPAGHYLCAFESTVLDDVDRSPQDRDAIEAGRRAEIKITVGDVRRVSAQLEPSNVQDDHRFDVRLTNRSQAPVGLHLRGNSPAGRLDFDLQPEVVALAPGQEAIARGRIHAPRHRWGSARLTGFSITVQGSGAPIHAAGTHSRRALFPAEIVRVVVIALLLVLWAVLLYVGLEALHRWQEPDDILDAEISTVHGVVASARQLPDNEDAAIPGATVTLMEVDGEYSATIEADGTGQFRFEEIPGNRTYELIAESGPNYRSAVKRIEVHKNMSATPIFLQQTRGLFRGTVRSADGHGLSPADVQLFELGTTGAGSDPLLLARTSEIGCSQFSEFAFEDLAFSDAYLLRVEADGYQGSDTIVPAVVEEWSPIEITLTPEPGHLEHSITVRLSNEVGSLSQLDGLEIWINGRCRGTVSYATWVQDAPTLDFTVALERGTYWVTVTDPHDPPSFEDYVRIVHVDDEDRRFDAVMEKSQG